MVAPLRPKLIEFVPNPKRAETVTAPEPEPEPLPATALDEDPVPGRSTHRRRRPLVIAVVVVLVGVAVVRAVLAARVTDQYASVCVDVRTQQRVQIERCGLTGQNAYQRWYIAAGNRIPALGEAPQNGGTDAPAGKKVRISEDFAVEGGLFDPDN
jgi:hypothetical protein